MRSPWHAALRRPFVAPLLLGALLSCGDDPAAPASDPLLVELVEAGGNGQEAEIGAPLEQPIRVRLRDAEGRPLAGVTIRFQVLQGGGQVEPELVTTDAAGLAAAAWTLGGEPGLQRAVARVVDREGLRGPLDLGFAANAIGPAAALVMTAQPKGVVAAAELLPKHPRVGIRDLAGNPILRVGVPVTVRALSGEVVGTTTVPTAGNGIARFRDLQLLGADGTVVELEFTAPGLLPVRAAPILLVGTAEPPPVPAAPH